MWEMQMMSCTESCNNHEATPSNSPETPTEPTASPISSTTDNNIDNVESAKPVLCRKRPLVATNRPTMSPTKRTVMSLLARARAMQNKEHTQPMQIVNNQTTPTLHHHGTVTLLAQPSTAPTTAVSHIPRIRLIDSSVGPSNIARQQPSIISVSHSHQLLTPALKHSFIHTQ